MLFSTTYTSDHKKEANELRCPYNQLGRIVEIAKVDQTKRFAVVATDQDIWKDDLNQLRLLGDITANYTVACKNIKDIRALIDKGIPAYLDAPITDWEMFNNFCTLGVSDIKIDGPLTFQNDLLLKAKGDIYIRVNPTVSVNLSFDGFKSPTSAYIRPEDLPYYSSIDVLEFSYPQDTYFKIYKRGDFNYDISHLIHGLPAGVINSAFDETFGQRRANCGQRCQIPNRQCHICESYFCIIPNLKKIQEYLKN